MDLPNDEALRWIVTTFAHLSRAHGQAIGVPALLQPTGEFFPDEFRPDGPSLERFLRRMLDYTPVSRELRVELAVVVPEEGQAGGCGAGACGTGAAGGGPTLGVQELDAGYRVIVSAVDVGNPDLLATSLARSMGALVLHEADEPVGAATSELAAVMCGFGVLLANGASVWSKSCGGLRMAQATVLPVEELAVLLALFVGVHRSGVAKARKHLGATQREAFEMACDWVEANPRLIELLRSDPQRVESGTFDFEPVRGLLGQWLARRSAERALRAPPKNAGEPMTEERRRRLEEVSALLDLSDT